MLLSICITISLLMVCGGSEESSFPIFQYAQLVADLSQWYRAHCVFVVNTGDHGREYSLVRLRKQLSHLEVFTVHLALEELANVSGTYVCRENRPLYVLFEGLTTLNYVQEMGQMTSYPRWLLFLGGVNESMDGINDEVNDEFNDGITDVINGSMTSKEDFFTDINIPFDCEFLLADRRESDDSTVVLSEVFRVAEGWPLNQVPYGVWDNATGLSATDKYLYDRRNNLQGLELPAGAYHLRSTPTLQVRRDASNRVTVDGYFGKVANTLAYRVNLTLNITQYVNITYGSLSGDGTWDGFIALVLNKELHLVLNDLTMNVDRRHAVDFLMPLVRGRVRLFIRKPDALNYKWNKFLDPFSTVLWLAILTLVLFIAVMLAGVHHLNRRHVNQQLAALSLADSFFYVLALFCLQGPSVNPLTRPSRAVFLLAGLTSIVIVAAYSAALTSFLTTQKPKMPFETIRGFVQDGSYKLGVVRNALRVYFSNPTGKLYKDLYYRFIVPNMQSLPTTAIQGMRRMCKDRKYAILSEMDHATDYLTQVPCEIVPLPEHLMRITVSMIISKDSPYRGILNHNLHSMRDSGVLQHIQKEVWPDPLLRNDFVYPSVDIYHVIPILVILASGLVISTCLTVLELIVLALVTILQYYNII